MAGGRAADARSYCYRDILPFTAIVSMECVNVSLNTLFKLATRRGMSRFVFLVFIYSIAALILLPSPFLSRRSRVLPNLNFSILLKIFFLAVVGYLSQVMGYTGINYGSPTLASAMSTLTPAFTFVLAVIFRMEKLALSSRTTQAKLAGTIISISGALLVAFCKGPILNAPPSSPISLQQPFHSSRSDWMIGSLFLAVEYFLVPVWYIILAHIMKEFPAELTVMFFYNFFVSIQAVVVAIFAEPDSSKWLIRPSVALASVLCSGIFSCCINNSIHTWALHLRGPVYVAMFKPLSIAIAAAMGVVVLGDTLYLGSIVGATIIALGFYTVMWGKAKEELLDFDTNTGDLESLDTQKYPLLQSHKTEAS